MFSFKTYACPELPVELPDGRTLHLIPAAKGLVDKIQHVERTVEGIYGMCAEILSANREEIPVSVSDISMIPMTALVDFMKKYNTFIRSEVDQNPN